MMGSLGKPPVLTRPHTSSMGNIRAGYANYEASWERAVDYLASHAGRWVPGWELADALYGGICSGSAVPMAVTRARRYFRIESNKVLGYRIGRQEVTAARCPNCGARRVRYPDEWVCYGCPGTHAVDLEVGRTPYAEGSRGGKPWTDDELDLVHDNLELTYDELGVMVNRTGSAVRHEVAIQGWDKPYGHSKAGEA